MEKDGQGKRSQKDRANCVFIRLAPNARHSHINTAALDDMIGSADTIHLHQDLRDASVYYFALPSDIAPDDATRIISTLSTQSHIDEAWQNEMSVHTLNTRITPELS